jgi:hypothetical protein
MAKFLARSGQSAGNYFQTPGASGSGGLPGSASSDADLYETFDRAQPLAMHRPAPVLGLTEDELAEARTPAERAAMVHRRLLARMATPKFIVAKVETDGIAPSVLDLAARHARLVPGSGDYEAGEAFDALADWGKGPGTKGDWGDWQGSSVTGSLSASQSSSLAGSLAESSVAGGSLASSVASGASRSRFAGFEKFLAEQSDTPGPASYQRPLPARPPPSKPASFSTLPHPVTRDDVPGALRRKGKSRRASMTVTAPDEWAKTPSPPPPSRGPRVLKAGGGGGGASGAKGWGGAALLQQYGQQTLAARGPGPATATVGFVPDRNGRLTGASGVAGLRLVESRASLTCIDLAVRRAAAMPGPSDYGTPALPDPSGGGKFNQSVAKSDLEWAIYRAQQLPGPGQNDAPKLRAPRGGKFNTSLSKSDIERTIFREKAKPGPGTYSQPPASAPAGGTMSASSAKSDLERTLERAAARPGPGDHDPNTNLRFPNPSSGKFSMSHHPVLKKGRQGQGSRASGRSEAGRRRVHAVVA